MVLKELQGLELDMLQRKLDEVRNLLLQSKVLEKHEIEGEGSINDMLFKLEKEVKEEIYYRDNTYFGGHMRYSSRGC